ncbi:MAG: PD40 domain-containing protein, partial [Caldilineaceae bacterium]|nr:PD40 domain-containing protein [Caldilineaceae bacterium]
ATEAPAATEVPAPTVEPTEAAPAAEPGTSTETVTSTEAVTSAESVTTVEAVTSTEAVTSAGAGPDPVMAGAETLAVDLPAAAAAEPAGRVLAPAGVNIRTGPGTAYAIVGVAAQGTTGGIVGVSEDGQWWVARVPFAPGGQGWVATAYIEATNAENVPVIAAPPLPAAGAAAAPAAAPVAMAMPAATPVPVPDELPSGSVILFSASRVLREGNRAYDLEDIYSVPAGPGSTAQLIIHNAMQPALQRGGNILAFRSTQSDQLGLSAYDFGADVRVRYSNFVEDSRPRWSPTGDRIVFSSNRTGDRRWKVYITPPTPSDDRSGFPRLSELTLGKDADWHPSSEQIVFKGCDDTGNACGLWTINADGSSRSPLTGSSGDSLPRWSPNGASVVFMSDTRDGNWELYSLSAADGAVTRLTDDPANDGLPAWSPDGSQIAFMSNRNGAWGIWVMPAGGGEAQLITSLDTALPDWLLQGLDWPR